MLSCNNTSDKTYEDSKEKLVKKETKDPLSFLTVDYTSKRNIIGQTVVRGVVKNSAAVSSYKNVRIKLLYYNESGELVTNHEQVIGEAVPPNGEVSFKAKYHTPKGTDSVNVSIMKAEVMDEKK